ncbi:iron(III) dicitrate transport FecA domain protein, partial [Helicobacter pylori]
MILLKKFKQLSNLSKYKELVLHKKVLLALTTSLICQESLFAKDKDYTLGKVSTAGKKDRSDYSGQVNLGYSGITAPKSW